MEIYDREFEDWIEVKIDLNKRVKVPLFNQRDIWWVALGQNIGHEQNGKSKYFSRPVLIVRKLSKNMAICVPLSTKIKVNTVTYNFTFQNDYISANPTQLRVIDTKRFYKRMGTISKPDFESIILMCQQLFALK
jgi:mRNA interferase MazF